MTKERLQDLSARLTVLIESKKPYAIGGLGSLDGYSDEGNSAANSGAVPLNGPAMVRIEAAWSEFIAWIKATRFQLDVLLDDLRGERGDLVPQSVYQNLMMTLGGAHHSFGEALTFIRADCSHGI
jgi:hypothetical protein